MGSIPSGDHMPLVRGTEREGLLRSSEHGLPYVPNAPRDTSSTLAPSYASRIIFGSSPDSQYAGTPTKESVDKQDRGVAALQKSKETTGQWFLLWWPELAAIVISAAFLVAVFVVLLTIDETPLQNWSMPFDINPTALIAILITLCRVFLLAVVAQGLSQLKWVYFEQHARKLEDFEHFDSASRGPLGAINFLYQIRWRALAGSLGALLMILIIAIEPFAQQTISFYSKTFPGKAAASISQATKYDLNTVPQTSPYLGTQNREDKGHYAPMLGSILEGLYNPDNPMKFSCPSTNCTWQPHLTLGVCSSCKDVSSMLTKSCYVQDYGGGHCTYVTPGGVRMRASCSQYGGGSASTVWNSTVGAPGGGLPGIADIAVIQLPTLGGEIEDCGFSPNFTFPTPHATECSLSWCARTYQSKVVNGVLSDNVLRSEAIVFPQDTCRPQNYSYLDEISNRYIRTRTQGYLITYLYAAFMPDKVPNNICSDWQDHDHAPFWINTADSLNIYNALSEIFTQSEDTISGPILAQLLYSVNNGNLSRDINGIAESMTRYIRQGPNATTVDGTVRVTETYIRVNWPWLVYPLLLVILAMGFLVVAMLFSTRRSRVVWKSSALAPLFHGLQGWDKGELHVRRTADMKSTAQGMWAQLGTDGYRDLALARK